MIEADTKDLTRANQIFFYRKWGNRPVIGRISAALDRDRPDIGRYRPAPGGTSYIILEIGRASADNRSMPVR